MIGMKNIKELFYNKFRSSFLEQLDLGLIQSLRISEDILEIWFENQEEVLVENYFKYHFKGAYSLVVSVESQPAKPDATHNGIYKNTQEYAWLQAVEFCEEFLKSQEFQIAKAKHDLEYYRLISLYENNEKSFADLQSGFSKIVSEIFSENE